jgi:hypothetical protein
VYVDWLFCLSRNTYIAELKRKAMSLQYAALMQSQMVWPMEMLLHCALVDGAKMSILRWKSSHQKGAALLMESQVVVAMTMAWMMEGWRLENTERFWCK